MMVRETTCPERFRDREIRPGAQVVISPWHLHRHSRLWNDPDLFDPARYTTENGAAGLRNAYIPFSAGQRVCPGAGFAMIEGPLLLAMLVRAYRFTPVAERPAMPVAHLTVRGRDGIWLKIARR
jgi:cytochrome P450